jgi:hypothetical protein
VKSKILSLILLGSAVNIVGCGIEEKLFPGECREDSAASFSLKESNTNDKFQSDECLKKTDTSSQDNISIDKSSEATGESKNSVGQKENPKANEPLDIPFYNIDYDLYLLKTYDNSCECFSYEYWNEDAENWLPFKLN